MRRWHLIGLLAFAGCGGGGTTDMATAGDDLATAPGSDLAAPPGSDLAGPPAGDLGARPDLTMVVSGNRLATGNLSVIGFTTDGYLAYTNDDTNELFVVPLAGGMAQRVAGNVSSSVVYGKVVFGWHDGDQQDNGPLAVWTKAAGTKEVAKMAAGGQAAASADGSLIAWFDNVDAGGNVADLVIDKADHSALKVAAKQVGVTLADCIPSIDFVGSRLVASHCAPVGDGGTPSVSVTSYDATGAGVDLATDAADYWVADKAGTMVLVTTPANVGTIFPVAGGKAIVAKIADVQTAEFTSDGSALIYATASNKLARLAVPAGGMPVVLQASGVADLDALSPDGKFMLFHTKSSMNGYSDLLLAGTAQAAMPKTLVATATGATGGLFGEPFSTDSTQALFFAAIDEMASTGTFTAQGTGAGAARGFAPGGTVVAAGAGAKVAFTANFLPVQGAAGVADLYAVDLAKAGGPSLLATQVALDVAITPDGKSVAYSYGADPGKSGIYLVPLP